MKRTIRTLVLAGATAILLSGTINTFAQRGNFDPAERRQQTMDNYRERLGISSDDEWKVLQPRVEKVYDARQAVQAFSFFGRGGGGGGRRGGGRGGDQTAGGGRGGFGGQTNPTAEALSRAIEANASNDELKQLLAKWRDEKKAKEADLAKAQDDLKQLLSVKQEAVALTMSLVR